MAQDFYIQPDAPDPVLEAEAVLRIVRQHAPTARSVHATDENGGEARVYAIDDDLILKVQRPQQVRPRTSLVKERFFLESLGSVPGVRVPRVLGGGVAPDIEYTLLTRMPDVAIEMADLSRKLRRRALATATPGRSTCSCTSRAGSLAAS